MKDVDHYRWLVPQTPPKKPYLTRYWMTLEEGQARYPTGEPDLSSKEVRSMPDTPQEREFRGIGMVTNAPGEQLSDWVASRKD